MPYDSVPQLEVEAAAEVGTSCNPVLLAKIDTVIYTLRRRDLWCKQQFRRYDGAHCILGAMMVADGVIGLKLPILFAIEQVTGRDYPRIELFNDSPMTKYPLVMQVLQRARQNIADGITPVLGEPLMQKLLG